MSASDPSIGKPYIYHIHGTVYPYINVSQSGLNPLLTKFRRSIADINPFAYPQIPTQARAAFGLRYGNSWFQPDIYPNYVTFTKWFATHYDPLKDAQFSGRETHWSQQKYAPANTHPIFVTEKLPRACVRTLQTFERCKMINGESKCGHEGKEILEICPNWALDEMKEKVLFLKKAQAIQNKQYRAAMEVSEYNKGRTPADVSDKLWRDGTRHYLRPDTMWADERYAKITQAEINEAKKRVAAREAHGESHKHHDKHHGHGHDHHDTYIATIKQAPLYP
jgi:hypothetical protein